MACVKLVAELQAGVTTETEVARIERGEQARRADLGLRLDEVKQLTAALQAEMVAAQLAVVGERRRGCVTCGRPLASKDHYRATFRSLFGDVPVQVRRLLVCPYHGPSAAVLGRRILSRASPLSSSVSLEVSIARLGSATSSRTTVTSR